MAVRFMAEVWDYAPVRGVDLLMLLALADFADGSGRCWPSQQTLAHKARVSRRAAQRSLKRLIDAGFLVVTDPGTPISSARYQLNPSSWDRGGGRPGDATRWRHGDATGGVSVALGGRSADAGGAASGRRGGGLRPQDPPVDPSGDPSKGDPASDSLADKSSGWEAWVQLLDWLDGLHDSAVETEAEIPGKGGRTTVITQTVRPRLGVRTARAFAAIGGERRIKGWEARPQDLAFARREFLQAWLS